MIKIGLTGSIGMGKTTTAKMFADEGVPVWDADAAVARLYASGGAGVSEVSKIAPTAIVDGSVDRAQLKTLIHRDAGFLKKLEQIIHPLVKDDRKAFLDRNVSRDVVLLDIPLLFENGTEDQVDVVVVATTSAEDQRSRVMSRGTMDEATFQMILSKQTPDSEKRKHADFIIETTTIEHARQQVRNILDQIRTT